MNGCDAFICDLIAVVTLKMSLQKIEFCHLFSVNSLARFHLRKDRCSLEQSLILRVSVLTNGFMSFKLQFLTSQLILLIALKRSL